MSKVRGFLKLVNSRRWEYSGLLIAATISYLLGGSFFWVIAVWFGVLVALTILWSRKPPQKLLTPLELVRANPDMTVKELELVFSKDVDIFSRFWLFAVGVVLGLYSNGLPNAIQTEISVLGTKIPSIIISFSFAIVALALGLVWLTRVVISTANPFRVRQKLFLQYLEARRELVEIDKNQKFYQKAE